MTNSKGVLVTGNTYPVKEQIKALGGRWDALMKGWRVPESRAAEARAIVRNGPSASARTGRNSPAIQALRATLRAHDAEDIVRGSAAYYMSGQYDEES